MPYRYYSSASGQMLIQAPISASAVTVTLDTVAGLPLAYPYTLVLAYGGPTEEVVDVTAAAGATLTILRGRDGTVAQAQALGAKVRHVMTARDLRESRDHEVATSVHGVSTIVGLTETQELDNKTFKPTGPDHAALVVAAAAANATGALEVRDSATSAVLARWLQSGLAFVNGATTHLIHRQGGGPGLFKEISSYRVGDDVHAIVGSVVGTPTGKFLRLLAGAVERFAVTADGHLGAQNITANGNLTATGNTTLVGPTTAGVVNAQSLTSTGLVQANAGAFTTLTQNGVDVLTEDDTGWLSLPLITANWASSIGQVPMYRRFRGAVYMRGAATCTGTLGGQIGTLPVGFRPAGAQFLGARVCADTGGAKVWELLVDANGVVSLPTGYGTASLTGSATVPTTGQFAI